MTDRCYELLERIKRGDTEAISEMFPELKPEGTRPPIVGSQAGAEYLRSHLGSALSNYLGIEAAQIAAESGRDSATRDDILQAYKRFRST